MNICQQKRRFSNREALPVGFTLLNFSRTADCARRAFPPAREVVGINSPFNKGLVKSFCLSTRIKSNQYLLFNDVHGGRLVWKNAG